MTRCSPLLALLLAGCSGWIPMTQLNIHPDSPPEVMAGAIYARDAWCAATPVGCVPVAISRRNDGGLLRHTREGHRRCGSGKPAVTTITGIRPPVIKLCTSRVAENDVAWIVAHELGHALAARDGHIKSGSVMKELVQAQGPVTINDADISYVEGGK